MNTLSFQHNIQRVTDWWTDTFYNYASSGPGFLRLAILCRIVILFVLTLGFGILHRTIADPIFSSQIVIIGLLLYFAIIVFQVFFSIFLPEIFESNRSIRLQLFIDILVVAFFYYASGDPKSGIYLFYFLPALTVAHFFSPRASLLFLVILVLTGVTWWQTIPRQNYRDLAFWITELLPQVGYIAILGVFYLIHHRRRNLTSSIEKTQDEIEREYRGLTSAGFSVDQDLQLTGLSTVLIERHGTPPRNATCHDMFCKKLPLHGEKACADCPVQRALKTGQPTGSVQVKFVDYEGFSYEAQLEVMPLVKDHRMVGAVAFVEDLSAQKRFEHHLQAFTENVEDVIELHTHESREQVRKMKTEINSLLAASTAVLTEDASLSLQQVAKTTLDLLHSTAIGVREYGIDERTGKPGLLLRHGEGLTAAELKERRFLDLSIPSIAVQAFQIGEIQAVEDLQAYPGLDQFPGQTRRLGFRSTISYPLIAQNQPLGTMTLHRRNNTVFTPHEKELGTSLANLLAAIIFNHRLLAHIRREAEQRRRELDALGDFSRKLAPQEDVNALAKLVASLLKKELKAETTAVFLRDGDVLRREAIWGVEDDWFVEEQYRLGEGLTGLAALPGDKAGEEFGQVVLENNVSGSGRAVERHLKIYSERMDTKTAAHLIAVPLYGQQGNFGALRVVNKLLKPGELDPKGFTQDDANLMSTIGCIVAVAMENARRLSEKAFLMDLGKNVTGSLSTAEVLTTSLYRAVEMLNAEAGFILLMHEPTHELGFRVTYGNGTERLDGQILPSEAGVAYQVAETERPLMLNDTIQDRRFTEWLYQHSRFTTRSIISVPIQARRKVVGVFEVVNKRNGIFTINDVHLLEALAPWTGIAIENAYLFAGEQKRRQLAESLHKSGKVLASSLDLDEILESILDHLDEVINYDTASVYLLQGDKLRLVRFSGFTEEERAELKNLELDPKTDIPFQRVSSARAPILIPDLARENEPILQHVVSAHPIRSWIGAPLLFEEEVLGLLSVDNFAPDKYDSEDGTIVMAFAQYAAVAIHNARLFGQEKERARILFELQDRLKRITLSPDRNATLNETAFAARDLIHADMAGVALYDDERQMISADPEAGFIGVEPDYAKGFRFPLDHTGGELLRKPGVYSTEDALTDLKSVFGHRLVDSIGARGIIASTLIVGEKKIGVLYAANKTPRCFTKDEQAYFSILANHAAIAIRNMQLLYKTKRHNQLLDLFLQISVTSQHFTDREQIVNIILTGVTAEYGLRFNRTMLLIYDKQQGVLKGLTGIGQTDPKEAHRIWELLDHQTHSLDRYVTEVRERGIPAYTPVHFVARNLQIPIDTASQEVFSRAVKTRKASIIDPKEEQVAIDRDFYRLFSPGMFALVPLVISGEVVGVLVADNKFTDTPINEFELDLLAACANQASAALERVNLYEELETRIDILTNLQEVGRQISDLTDPREVLKRIVTAANDVLHADISYLVPYDDDKKELIVELGVSAGNKTNFSHDRKVSEYGLTKRALEEPGGLIVIEDLQHTQDLYSSFARAEGAVSVAVIRLEFQKKILGLLYVNYLRPYLLSDPEQATLRMFASQAALSINNSRLMHENSILATQKERNRLREDLHDVLNTYQFKVMVPAELLSKRLARRGDQDAADQADNLWVSARHSYVQLERILQDMREPVLIEKGLVAAFQHILAAPNLPPIEFYAPEKIPRLPADIELMLYRICQEAVANIAKHAGLSPELTGMASVRLEFSPGHTRMVVQDHGRGFNIEDVEQDEKHPGMGLQAMFNWARNIGAKLDIQSAPENGTRVEVTVMHLILEEEEQL